MTKAATCRRPPTGWYCSREPGHDGPCAARPEPEPQMTEALIQGLGQFPHCDVGVLHARGECDYCDRHPVWQALRVIWGIAFTGHAPQADELPCPSDHNRGRHGAHGWYGNRPTNVQVPVEETPASRTFYGNPE